MTCSAIAIIPGRITRAGNSIFGIAASRGVRRAAAIESAAMARWTTRKSVHQYPNDSTKPSPITMPNHSTPMGLALAAFRWCHESDQAPAAYPAFVATVSSLAVSPAQPPMSLSPRSTNGRKPMTMRKNCSTSL